MPGPGPHPHPTSDSDTPFPPPPPGPGPHPHPSDDSEMPGPGPHPHPSDGSEAPGPHAGHSKAGKSKSISTKTSGYKAASAAKVWVPATVGCVALVAAMAGTAVVVVRHRRARNGLFNPLIEA
eukprot:m51a1_g1377 hypothetical protein (123) ;mRNA; r:441446-441814